jgi:imidazolonepropionase
MNELPLDLILTDASIATMEGEGYGTISQGAIGVRNGQIVWLGATTDAPAAREVMALAGKWVTPALIDCHTHLVYAGNRAGEFEQRLHGVSYTDIARAGGGILATVNATRHASIDGLVASALTRLDCLMAEGVGTVEIKSGYGLNLADEIKMLRAARQLQAERKIQVKTSFLGAHTLPPEYAGRADDYIAFVCEEMLPAAHAEGLVDAVDGFCESIAFTPAQIERVFETAEVLGLPIKLHAEQLSHMGGAAMAAMRGALSVDHLEYLPASDAALLAQHHTVAVLLPTAFYMLRETQRPPLDALRNAGVPMAVATDCNPGSSPNSSLLLSLNMGCTLFGLTPQEALAGCTRAAAQALGLLHERGTIAVGKRADFAIWDIAQPAELCYHMGHSPLHARMIGGTLCP